MRRWRKSRHTLWVHALVVGVLLAGEVHLFTAEILHHHDDVARMCQIGHQGGTYLHAAPEISPLCPLCQIVRTGSVQPAIQSLIAEPDQESAFHPLSPLARYSSPLTASLLARAPPLS